MNDPSIPVGNAAPPVPVPSVVSPMDVRMFLIDRGAADNELLDAPEFAPDQLASAIRLCVDKYNSTPPLLCEGYDVHSFPYRYELITGTAGILLLMAALNLTRNKLPYTTREGTAVDDKARAADYIRLAQSLSAEFDARIKALKVSANLRGMYGNVGSEFRYVNAGID